MKLQSILTAACLAFSAAASYKASSYQGFGSVSNIFIFGASYDSTNVPLPVGEADVSTAWGYLWPMWLTERLSSGKNRINYAIPGATTDVNVVGSLQIIPGFLEAKDLVDQVSRFVSDTAAGKRYAPGWTGTNSLFFFPGSNTGNDIVNSWRGDGITRIPALKNSLDAQFERLWSAGARQFVFLPILPVEVTPNTTRNGQPVQSEVDRAKAMVTAYQSALDDLARTKASKYASQQITIIQPDTTVQLRNLQSGATPSSYVNRVSYCQFNKQFPCFAPFPKQCDPNANALQCGGLGVFKYAFVDDLHVTEPAHGVIAQAIINAL